MPEQIADGFERVPGPQQVDGIGVAEAVGPVERDRQATPFGPALEDHRDGGAAQGAERGATMAEEERAAGDMRRAGVLQILHQRGPHPVGQREVQGTAGLAPWDPQPPVAPMEIVQGQGGDLTDAQPIGGDQQEHRVVTQSDGGATIDRRQQRLDGLPRQGAGELLEAIQPWGVDGGVQAGGTLACGGQKTEKTAQVGHEVLLGAAPQPPWRAGARRPRSGSHCRRAKACGVPIVLEVVEQRGQRSAGASGWYSGPAPGGGPAARCTAPSSRWLGVGGRWRWRA